MTDAEEKQLRSIERDRRERENEMLLFLLLFWGEAINYAASALTLGHDPHLAASTVLLGNAALDLAGVIDPLNKLLATSYVDGVRRVDLLMGVKPPASIDLLSNAVELYRQPTIQLVQGMTQTTADRITATLADIRTQGLAGKKAARFLKMKMADGFSKDNPSLLTAVTERSIVSAHSNGLFDGGQKSTAVWGYQFTAVLDDVTTLICKTCNGTRLPKDDPWWLTHTPSLHWGCRSFPKPIPVGSPLAVSTVAPQILAKLGFGRPWADGMVA